MSELFDALQDKHQSFARDQHMFFVGTAGTHGQVNISPKGADTLRILDANRIIWLNYTGSGNETAGHLLQTNRMTLMWCSFGKRPLILRAYGQARTLHPNHADWDGMAAHFDTGPGARQIYDMKVTLVQTSCGYSVPYMDHVADRDTLVKWTEDRGQDGLRDFWQDINSQTIDAEPTGIENMLK